MDVIDNHKMILESTPFKEWTGEHANAYLAHLFVMVEKPDSEVEDWQYGYYNPEDDLLTPFVLSKGTVTAGQADKVFKEPGSVVDKLELDSVKTDFGVAAATAASNAHDKFPGVLQKKFVCILQSQDGKLMWNITIVGEHVSTVNVRIDATNGDVLESHLVNLFEQLRK